MHYIFFKFNSWSFGYDGSPVYFLDNKTVCFLNGNCVKFINIENGATSYLPTPGDGIHNLTVNSSYGVIAFSEDSLDSQIFIYDPKELNRAKVTLKGIFEIFQLILLSQILYSNIYKQ